ncbi:RagB/SusD family nutrient uptake outer membrane protein [Williamwhitmania taraxaci]|uniref:Starch-binding associating with outer membrane n=1 Tax=Williamwhitmania taraxaci TaxID=1640674 RepID=A0A1G6HTK7_9BACT|nr:RagB/SusD family nutrient uptake outer membrane protein [Williamwhitmania taraxaci]SDB97571.1 Starch-binding associating with outer membrane [Williamwhitmania taraxaci]
MKTRNIILGIVLSTLMVTSCVKDLDITPKDPNTILSGNLGDDPVYTKQFLAKLYASFIISGQGSNGGDDIAASDGNFFTTVRALWNVQEITTDEAICAWGDIGISDLNTQTWSATNPFLTALYQRLGLSITYANQFIGATNGSTDPTIIRYNAEARFLRALAYTYYMDLFANPPFTTEADGVGKFFPKQTDRVTLFNYIVAELTDIEDKLSEPGSSSAQANKAAAWMLLARVYLNAGVYTGTPQWENCKIYCDKVINSGNYSLASNYRQNFSADNDRSTNPEMIFAYAQDGVNIQGYVGTTFIIESSSDARYIKAEDFHGLTNNTNWNGNRARKQFMNVLVDTLATYGNIAVPANDTLFKISKDTRVLIKMKKSMDIPSPSSSGDYGIGVYKFTATNADGTQAATYNSAYASTDFPVFRLADAYLMRAEANFNGATGGASEALADVNYIRDRAFHAGAFGANPANRIAAVTAKALLDERGREFYYEAQRRTDLIRFGQFTNGTYVWAWKGGVANGTSTSSHLNIFPIPGEEVSANPNIKQNTGY